MRRHFPGWIAAGIAIAVWGVTFASTRVLLEDFSALEINIARFALAWVALACAAKAPRKGGVCAAPWWLFAAMGFTGVFAYQFLENCAIYYTNASNVAILVSFGPVVTAVMARVLTDDHSLSPRLVFGSLVAVVGVALVALNGVVNFQLRPLGDAMALCAMASWGTYSAFVEKANRLGVEPIVAVRKSFGWALLMMFPLAVWGVTPSGFVALDGSYSVIFDADANLDRFASFWNWANLGFLGVFASAACFVLWSRACRVLGMVRATISLYLTPIVGVAFAAFFLEEKLTWFSVAGGVLILCGVAVANRRREEGK